MPTPDIALLPVLLAAVANMAVGMIWFSPSVFGKMWMKESGRSASEIEAAKKKGMGPSYVLAFLSSLVMAYVLAHFVAYAGASTVGEGMQAGFWSWLGFIATVGLGMVLWEGKSWKLYAVVMGNYLVALLVMGALLANWS